MLINRVRWLAVAGTMVLAAGLAPVGASAQQPVMWRDWELRGPQFDFRPDGVWRKRVRAIAAARAAAMARGDFATLNAAIQRGASEPSAYAVTGSLNVPAILIKYADTDSSSIILGDTTAYDAVLFGTTPPAGRPYTIRTFYEQMSGGLFSMRGAAVGWLTLSGPESQYVGPSTGCPSPFGTCNGVWSSTAYNALRAGLQEAITKVDSATWSRFGFDPASGTLEMVVFVQPNMDGACARTGNNHVWSHRGFLGGVPTKAAWPGHPGQFLNVNDYTIQAGVGGAQACDTTKIMAIGTAAHETGHGLGLPDLYDTGSGASVGEGIGEWGLMGSGNYARPLSPAFFEAWSRAWVGWTTVVPVTTSGAVTLNPVETADTVILLQPSGTNPRHEYFLLENRQGINSDSALIAKHGSPGLLVWHADSIQLVNGEISNTVNAGSVHGLVLVEADGLNNLLSSSGTSNRGDAGDPFPGSTGRTTLGAGTGSPSTTLNAGGFAGFVLDSIKQVVPGGQMRFVVHFGGSLDVAASDTAAKVRVRGALTADFRQFLVAGDTATISMDTLQTNLAGTARWRWASWSDGGARTHLVTVTGRDTTITAAVNRQFVVQWSATGPGTVTAAPASASSGSWFNGADTVGLTAQPNPGSMFMGWSGSSSAPDAHIVLTATQPLAVTANFVAAPLDSVVAQLLNGHGLTPLQVLTLDDQGNQNGHYDLGDFLAWLDRSGTPISAQLLARIFERVRP